MRKDSDPEAANATSARNEGPTVYSPAVKKSNRDGRYNRDSRRDPFREDQPENLRTMPKLDLKGNEVAKVGPSTVDPSLLQVLPKNKGNLELEQGTALGSVPGSSQMSTVIESNRTTQNYKTPKTPVSTEKDQTEEALSEDGTKANGAWKRTSKAKSAELPDRNGSKLRTQPAFVTKCKSKEKVKSPIKRKSSDLKQKPKSKDSLSNAKEPVNRKSPRTKSSDSSTRLKIQSRRKSNGRNVAPKSKERIKSRNRSLSKTISKNKILPTNKGSGGSGKMKQKPKSSDSKNK
ncbi:hypothetical protein TYRP_008242 [Tyrophagus putrescentiae]|nr:hypothetical protein TYRP_008242 [Tyrophagus putrescentiae]